MTGDTAGGGTIALPKPRTASGDVRKLGVEIEFAGLAEEAAARILGEVTGCRPERVDEARWQCETEDFGLCEIYLDTRFREKIAAVDIPAAQDLARQIVPVEIVTAPFDPARLDRLDGLREALRANGALGSRDGLFLGFGLHLNVEIHAAEADHLGPVLTAYALLEDGLRAADPLDLARRILPFVRAYPDSLVSELARRQVADTDGLIDLYLAHVSSRNHGLDMLPIFAGIDAPRVCRAVTDTAEIKPRPAYHYRLPDCRIDEPGWTVAQQWRRWVFVEEVASDGPLLAALRARRRTWEARSPLARRTWRAAAADVLRDAGREVPW